MHTFCTLLEVFILILSMPSIKDPAVFPIKQDLDSSRETLKHVGGILRQVKSFGPKMMCEHKKAETCYEHNEAVVQSQPPSPKI